MPPPRARLGRYPRRLGRARGWARVLGLAAALAPVRPAAACSLGSPYVVPVARPEQVAFVGHATADTAHAGFGAVQYKLEPGHLGRPPAARSPFGQVVAVGRLSPAAPRDLAAAVGRAGGRVVLVPWDYAADCQAVPWARSARWLPVATRGFFAGTLRDPAHWVDGTPTLDVFAPGLAPYTGVGGLTSRGLPVPPDGERLGQPSGGASPPILTPDELLDLRATLPTDSLVRLRLDTAFGPLRAWVAARPALAAREPARGLLVRAERMVADLHLRRRPLPLAGTYRVTVRTPDASTIFFLRTDRYPNHDLGPDNPLRGRYALACAAAAEADLPSSRAAGGCAPPVGSGTEGWIVVSDSTWTDHLGRPTRAGGVEVVHGDPAFRAAYARLTREYIGAAPDGDPRRFLPGLFTEGPGGRVTFAWTIGPPNAPRLRVTAERVSGVAIAP